MKNEDKSGKAYTPFGVSQSAMDKIWDKLEPITECDYCGGEVKIVNNYVIYHGYNYGKYPWIYYCEECGASIGIHDDTNIPKGTLADGKTKKARSSVFEHLKILKLALKTEDNAISYRELLKVCDVDLNETWVNVLPESDCIAVIHGCLEIAHDIEMVEHRIKFEQTEQYRDDKRKWEEENGVPAK